MKADGLRARARVLHALRSWFADHGYLEVPTNVLVSSPAMEPFLHPVEAGGGYLRTSPEFALKKVLAAGLPRIYEIGPCLRDREASPWHAREFTMVEWYRAGAALTDLMDEVEDLVGLAFETSGRPRPEWRRISVRALVQEVCGIDLAMTTASDLSEQDDDWDAAFFRRWVSEVEPAITEPTIVFDWPASQAALASVRTDGDWPVAERFEVYVDGVELANAFQELIDPREQLRRFAASNQVRMAEGEAPHPTDHALIEAVGRMPRTAGIALGLDRLVAVSCGWDGIGPGRAE